MMNLSNHILISLHIPKCGGMTLISILRENYPDRKRYYVVPSDAKASRESVKRFSEERLKEIELLHGHLSFGWHELFPKEPVYITMIRHPIDRVVSHYNYVRFSQRSHYLHDIVERSDMSIGEYVACGICDELNNGMVRLIAGVEDIVQEPFGNSKISYGTNDESLLQRALENVESHFAVVGLQEQYDQSLLVLRAILGLKPITYRPINVARQKYTKRLPTDEEIDIIKEYNQLDLALYKAMQIRFERQYATLLASGFQLKFFRLQNWLLKAYDQMRTRAFSRF